MTIDDLEDKLEDINYFFWIDRENSDSGMYKVMYGDNTFAVLKEDEEYPEIKIIDNGKMLEDDVEEMADALQAIHKWMTEPEHRPCPYCMLDKDGKGKTYKGVMGGTHAELKLAKFYHQVYIGTFTDYTPPINYCPMCGRELSEDNNENH